MSDDDETPVWSAVSDGRYSVDEELEALYEEVR